MPHFFLMIFHKKFLSFLLAFLGAFFVLSASLVANAAGQTKSSDLFSQHRWHAVSPSWPGTLLFDAATKQVNLAPMGAPAMVAKYAYKITKNNKKEKLVEGTMVFEMAADKKSEMTFILYDNTDLTLKFAATQKEETYKRMSPDEVKAYEAQLRKILGGQGNFLNLP